MMKKLIVLLIALSLLLCACGADSDAPNPNEGLSPAYDFTMQDMSGNNVKLSSFLDKPVVLNFWASWCPPCRGEMPDFEEAYNKYKDEVNFVMVSVDDTIGDASNFINSSGYTFPAYYDVNGEGGYLYGVSSIPRTYFINTDGYIAKHYAQAISSVLLEAGIEYILAK
jgi:thiol-disulfide isomerase/thioredoxin